MVTLPVLALRPAAILSTLLPLNLKSLAEAPLPAVAPTVIVTGVDTALDKRAVTAVVPPFSVIDEGDNIRVTIGISSLVLALTVALVRLSYLVSPVGAGLLGSSVMT